MKRKIIIWILALLPVLSFGQSKQELQKQRDALIAEIKYTNKLISESKKAQQMTESEMGILDRQIELRDRLLRSMRREVQAVDRSMGKNKVLIAEKEEELSQLKDEYAKLIYLSYKNSQAYDKMMYIFAADDFYQAYTRIKLLKELGKYREQQGEEIQHTKTLLADKNAELLVQKREKEALLSEEKKAQAQLAADRRVKAESLAELRKNEQDLKKKIKEQEKKQRELNKAIERIIAEEIRKSKKANGSKGYSLTPEEALSSKHFSANKGKLPWPVERGVITGSFGTHAHPVLPGIEITNNGIDISTEKMAMTRCLFDGEVSGVIEIPGSGMAVVVKHGGYRTVYSNLKEVLVSKGQTVSTKQNIGVLLPDGQGSKAHLEIWQVTADGMKKLNPATWIAR